MSPAIDPLLKHVPLDQIDEDPALQVRVKIDSQKIADYEVIIQETGWMAPMKIFRQPAADGKDPRYMLAAGSHRIRAYRNLGKKTAPCEILEGGLSEALEVAIASNVKHGLPMTRADKRKAARLLVEDPIHGQKKDAELAKLLCVSPSLISEIRRGIRPEDKRKPPTRKARSEPEPETKPEPRKPSRKPDPRPTSTTALRQIQQHVDLDVVDEADVVKLFNSPVGEYKFLPKPGTIVNVKLVSRTGRIILERPVVLKEAGNQGFVFKAEDVKSLDVVEA